MRMFKLSHVRKDGGVGELMLIGYSAEGIVLNEFQRMAENVECIRYCVVTERQELNGQYTWERITEKLNDS